MGGEAREWWRSAELRDDGEGEKRRGQGGWAGKLERTWLEAWRAQSGEVQSPGKNARRLSK